MTYTEQDVERVAEAIYEHDLTWVNNPTAFKSWDETANKDIYRGRARAAIEAMEREPCPHCGQVRPENPHEIKEK